MAKQKKASLTEARTWADLMEAATVVKVMASLIYDPSSPELAPDSNNT